MSETEKEAVRHTDISVLCLFLSLLRHFSFCEGLNLITSSNFNSFLKAPPPNTTTSGIEGSTYEFGGIQAFSP